MILLSVDDIGRLYDWARFGQFWNVLTSENCFVCLFFFSLVILVLAFLARFHSFWLVLTHFDLL